MPMAAKSDSPCVPAVWASAPVTRVCGSNTKGVGTDVTQVGVTAMLIASKYEEIWAPELNDFVYISDRAYKKDQILTMEKVMLNSLKFNLTGAAADLPLLSFLPSYSVPGSTPSFDVSHFVGG